MLSCENDVSVSSSGLDLRILLQASIYTGASCFCCMEATQKFSFEFITIRQDAAEAHWLQGLQWH